MDYDEPGDEADGEDRAESSLSKDDGASLLPRGEGRDPEVSLHPPGGCAECPQSALMPPDDSDAGDWQPLSGPPPTPACVLVTGERPGLTRSSAFM